MSRRPVSCCEKGVLAGRRYPGLEVKMIAVEKASEHHIEVDFPHIVVSTILSEILFLSARKW